MAKDAYLQAVRGAAICAMVAIHVLPQEEWAVAVRPLLNFCVASFIFLSGYLTPRDKTANLLLLYKRRMEKTAVPYAL